MAGKPAKILWKMSASRSDWRNGEPLRRLVVTAARLGLLGRPKHIEPEPEDPDALLSAKPGANLAAALLAACTAQGPFVELTVRGDDPAPWEIFWNVYPFDEDEGWVDGLNTLWFTFDRTLVADGKASDALLSAFSETSVAEDIEYAVMHPYDHWFHLSSKHYDIPVTNDLQFRGVFWANFLGKGHIEEFDPELLRDLEAKDVRWCDSKGIFVAATTDQASADAPDSESVLLRLTQKFRDALRPESRWG